MRGEVSQQEFFPFDPEIERTCRRNIALNRKHKQQEKRPRQRAQEAPSSPQAHTPPPQQSISVPPPILEEPIMAEENEHERRTLEDYAAHTIPQHFTSILRPQVQAASMSYPSSLIQLIRANQFHGLSHEDPYSHLATYLEICDTVKIAGVPDDAIRLNLFSFSLDGDAKAWLHSFKGHSLRTWDEVVSKFLNKYFPESKTTQGKTEISSFHQRPEETLSEAWDRFRGLLRKTPTHGFSEPVQINMFLDGLKSYTKQLLDASTGGKIKSKTSEEAIELIENMASSDPDLSYNRDANLSTKGVLELSAQDAMLAQNKLLAKQIEALTKQLSVLPKQLQSLNGAGASTTQSQESCQLCGGSHDQGGAELHG